MNRLGRDIDSTAVQTDAWHHRIDAITSVAAFIGISIALLGGENGIARMIGRRCLPARLSRLMAHVCSGLHCARSWTRRRAETLSTLYKRRRVPSDGVEGIEKPRIRKMGLSFMSIFMSAWTAIFPCAKATASRIE